MRLRYAYFIKCKEVVKDAAGEVVELHCTYDPATRGGDAPDGRKVKATHALGLGGARRRRPRCGSTTTCSLKPDPDDVETGEDFIDNLNPDSLEVLDGCQVEPSAGRRRRRATRYQFERLGYFCVDPDSHAGQRWSSTAR